jgi:hypothetical protein
MPLNIIEKGEKYNHRTSTKYERYPVTEIYLIPAYLHILIRSIQYLPFLSAQLDRYNISYVMDSKSPLKIIFKSDIPGVLDALKTLQAVSPQTFDSAIGYLKDTAEFPLYNHSPSSTRRSLG